jgi:two-component system chemotaxis response regulator CheY
VTALVVENDARIRLLVVRLIQSCGFDSIAEAADGREALAYLASHDPELILTDLDMPRMGGIEMVRRLRANGIRTPVIMLSAQDDHVVIEQARRTGISAYLAKPVDARALTRTIHRTLAVAARTNKRPGGGVKSRDHRDRRGVA